MKKYFIFILLVLNLLNADTINIEQKLSNQKCNNINEFSIKQIQYIIKSYIWGLPYGLEEILPSIAWQESCLGLYKVNVYDPSAGLYHAYLPSVMARHQELKNNKFNRNKIAQMLIDDDKFAVSEAIAELLFWKNFYKQNKNLYKKYNILDFMLRSYNRGTSWLKGKRGYKYNRISAINYSKQVQHKMKQINKFIKKFDIKKEIEKIY